MAERTGADVDPLNMCDVNTLSTGPGHVVDAMVDQGVERLVVMSAETDTGPFTRFNRADG